MSNLFGDYTTINSGRISRIIKRINDLSLECENITKDQTKVTINNNGILIHGTKEEEYFINKTNEFRKRLREGETIDDIMVEALALVKEAIKRRLGMTPYNVQLEACISMMGVRLNDQYRERVIAEMKTGEGKTLVQILVAYLNVLEATKDEDKKKWSSVHIITSNDALAKRDQKGNESVFKLLGITSGFVPGRGATKTDNAAQININWNKKKEAYLCDIVYATATTIAFDFLEDNTIYDVRYRNINRNPAYAIVDEADDILIDQAINPLRLSQTPRANGSLYEQFLLKREEETRTLYKWATDFLYGKSRKHPLRPTIFDQYYDNKDAIDNKEFDDYAYVRDTKEVFLSNRIIKEIGSDLGTSLEDSQLYNARYYALIDCIKAKEGFQNNVEYKVEVKDDKAKIVLIDQNIGRKKYSNKYTGGMQEAIEAKEEFLENESASAKKRYHIDFSTTLSIKAMCTYPDFFSIYEKHVCGMTGTSDEEEFRNLYGFETYRVRTRKRNIRMDMEDEVYATLKEKYNAIIEEVKACVVKGQPVLIGTTSLRESEIISSLLRDNFIRHQLLNANNEEEESQIVAGAGMYGTVTVATNMAGRGTDIKLGKGVRELGGLYVISTSKNKSKRVDRQLMGRAARQGDPGKSKSFSSLEDDLVKEYYRGSSLDGVIKIYKGTNAPIKNKKVTSAVKRSQELRESKDKKIRMDNERFNISFMRHRRIIYENRNQVLDSNPLEFMTVIKNILVNYSDFIVKNYSLKEIKNLIGHLVNVESLYDKNDKKFKANLVYSLYERFKSIFNIGKVSDKEVKDYVDDLKKKFLDIIDQYWLSYIEYLEELRSSVCSGFLNDPFKEFEQTSIKTFETILIPSMYNEMITYALIPGLKLGEYTINDINNSEEEEKKL